MSLAIINILKSDRTETYIADTADKIDALLDSKFKSKSEDLQLQVVSRVLLPLCEELLKEKPLEYVRTLEERARAVKVTISKNSPYL